LEYSHNKRTNHSETQDVFGQSGGFAALVKSLNVCNKTYASLKDPDVATILTHFTPQLRLIILQVLTLAVANHRNNQDCCSQVPAITEVLLKTMEKNETEASVQMHACSALEAITRDHKRNTDMLRKKGGLRLVTHAVSAFGHVQGFKYAPTRLLERLQCANADVNTRTAGTTSGAHAPHADSATSGAKSATKNERETGGQNTVMAGLQRLTLSTQNHSAAVAGSNPAVTESQEAAAQHLQNRKDKEVCVACGKTSAEGGVQLRKCSGCTLAPRYCSEQCQRASWPAHKAECKANRNTKT
jgi:hypothetical protein